MTLRSQFLQEKKTIEDTNVTGGTGKSPVIKFSRQQLARKTIKRNGKPTLRILDSDRITDESAHTVTVEKDAKNELLKRKTVHRK